MKGARTATELHALAEKRRRTDMREIRRELKAIRAAVAPSSTVLVHEHTSPGVSKAIMDAWKRASEPPATYRFGDFAHHLNGPVLLLGNRLGHRAWKSAAFLHFVFQGVGNGL